MACAYASHGDTRHVLLFPANPEEAFYLAAQAFGRLMERDGRGAIVFVCAPADGADAATRAARAGLGAVAGAITREWGRSGVSAIVAEGTPEAVKDRVLGLLPR